MSLAGRRSPQEWKPSEAGGVRRSPPALAGGGVGTDIFARAVQLAIQKPQG
jgi:hypothetical protein